MFVTDKTNVPSKNHSAIGLRAAIKILDKWSASVKQAFSILRISPSTISRAKNKENTDWTVNLDVDAMQRISLVLNIHNALRLTFDNPDNVYGFTSMKNGNEFFSGRSPLEVMAQGDFVSLYETFKQIESLRVAG